MALYRSCVLSIFSDLLRLIYPCVTLSFRILFSGQLRIFLVLEVSVSRNGICHLEDDLKGHRGGRCIA